MCIRDRASADKGNEFSARVKEFAAKEGNSAVVVSAKIESAVSYTHLRAHETVLDLVCRLLLEKKKHTL